MADYNGLSTQGNSPAVADDSRFRAQITEVINHNAVVSRMLRRGYNAYLPVYDGGVDFILHRERDNDLILVQLKARWNVDLRYEDRGISMAFPAAGGWYLIPHDKMVEMAEQQGFTKTSSWIDGGGYSCPRLSKALLEACAPYRLPDEPNQGENE